MIELQTFRLSTVRYYCNYPEAYGRVRRGRMTFRGSAHPAPNQEVQNAKEAHDSVRRTVMHLSLGKRVVQCKIAVQVLFFDNVKHGAAPRTARHFFAKKVA